MLASLLSSGTNAAAADAPMDTARERSATTLRTIADRYSVHRIALTLFGPIDMPPHAGRASYPDDPRSSRRGRVRRPAPSTKTAIHGE